MPELLETRYRGIDRLRLVQDTLNTHPPGAFDQALAPHEACDLAQTFELHDTPIKGSWLNMAEIERSALARQCLDRRIGSNSRRHINLLENKHFPLCGFVNPLDFLGRFLVQK